MTRLSLVKAILSAQQLFNDANELNRFKGFDNVGIGSDFRFFRTYTVENSSSSLSAQQGSKVDKYQFNKNSKP
jgi:hypothetical protein